MDRKKYENIAGWLNRQVKQKDGWMDIKNVWIERKTGWMDKTNRWMVGRKTKLLKKQMVGWMDRKNRQIPKWKIGWIEKYAWLDG